MEKRDATENDINSLPQVSDKLPVSVYIALAGGAMERFAYFALTTPWQNYMQNPRIGHAIPGALNLGQSTATNINNTFLLFSFVTPMGFALLSDLSYGRLKTLKIALASYLAGCLILLCTSLPVSLDNGAGVPGLAVAMILVAIGVGGVKATFSPFLGDQYAQRKPRVVIRGDKEVVVTSPLTLQFIYNLFYWLTNIASMSMVPSTFLEFKIEFWTSYLLATVSISFTIILFFLGSPKLRQIPPQGNILPEARRVIVCAIKNGFKLDSARHISANDNFVDEIRTGLLACRVISCFVFFYLATNQMYNNLVAQAGQMKLSGIPNDMIQVIAGVACIVLGPIMQWLYKFLAKHRIPFGPMLRITLAFVFCALAMTFAAVTQKLIYSTGPCYNRPLACEASDGGRRPNNISVWIQTPTYCLLAIGEILGFVTGSEYAYNKAPPGMKTIVQALVQLSACAAGALGMAISPVAKDPSLVAMYSCLAGAIIFFAFLFWLFFRKWDARDDELNIRQEETKPVSPTSDGREVEMTRN
ncbi:MFS general substrate transporter [Pyrenochaeta sp. DS3sAY3a]|nr:MFS general substrate transporter [Pyrenochaeta sp. DS3sAY3a]